MYRMPLVYVCQMICVLGSACCAIYILMDYLSG